MKQKSLKINTILYAFKNFMGVIFPMLTFPYASRVLGAEGIGNVTFSYSIVSYFVLIAGLGVLSYAIREGSKYRDNKEKFSLFACEVYTINVIATVISSLAFCFTIFFFESLQVYRGVLLILGLTIPLTTVGVEWIFNIFEDYLYITIRSLIVQFISLGILFIFVRKPEDIYEYTIFYLFSTAASNIFNLFYAQKYCRLHFCFDKNLKKHMKPIMVIFASAVASTIYVSTDTTLLGIMHDDATVGYYAASTKIYNLLRTSMDAIISVSFVRLSFYLGNCMQEEFDRLVKRLVHVSFLLLGPLSVGVFCLSTQAIHILNGEAYEPAIMSLRILCLALPISAMGGMLTRTLFLPYKHEKDILIATIVGAFVNFVLNLYFIPRWRQDGAAMTTLIAEIVVLCIHLYNLNKFYKIRGIMKCFIQVLLSSLAIAGICWLVNQNVTSDILCTLVSVAGSGVVYVLILIILKNELITEFIQKIKIKKKNIS